MLHQLKYMQNLPMSFFHGNVKPYKYLGFIVKIVFLVKGDVSAGECS